VVVPADLAALLLDLDGVVTRTAAVHVAAWRRLLDELFAHHGQPPLDMARDYREHIDGRPRRDALRDLLTARGLPLAEGSPDDGPEIETIHGLAARKQRYFLDALARDGVDAYPDALRLIRRARAADVRLAIVSASENCERVLAAARLAELFEVRICGHDVTRLGLRGKPAPDAFLAAARGLGVDPRRCAVLEDAAAGVAAGRAGDFGLVIGVARGGDGAVLARAGADVVVATLDEVVLAERASLEAR
jgi:beta-phosphoglucomutase family hydrolase